MKETKISPQADRRSQSSLNFDGDPAVVAFCASAFFLAD
jgi:hypothetical protein